MALHELSLFDIQSSEEEDLLADDLEELIAEASESQGDTCSKKSKKLLNQSQIEASSNIMKIWTDSALYDEEDENLLDFESLVNEQSFESKLNHKLRERANSVHINEDHLESVSKSSSLSSSINISKIGKTNKSSQPAILVIERVSPDEKKEKVNIRENNQDKENDNPNIKQTPKQDKGVKRSQNSCSSTKEKEKLKDKKQQKAFEKSITKIEKANDSLLARNGSQSNKYGIQIKKNQGNDNLERKSHHNSIVNHSLSHFNNSSSSENSNGNHSYSNNNSNNYGCSSNSSLSCNNDLQKVNNYSSAHLPISHSNKGSCSLRNNSSLSRNFDNGCSSLNNNKDQNQNFSSNGQKSSQNENLEGQNSFSSFMAGCVKRMSKVEAEKIRFLAQQEEERIKSIQFMNSHVLKFDF